MFTVCQFIGVSVSVPDNDIYIAFLKYCFEDKWMGDL